MTDGAVRIAVGPEPFDAGREIARFGDGASGGIGCFVGVVRGGGEEAVSALELEHYPAMTEAALRDIAGEAMRRFALEGCTVIHRVGVLRPGDPIVLVVAAAGHRGAALDATRFLIDWLKTRAPFWKKEHLSDGSARWVDAREADDAAAAIWDV